MARRQREAPGLRRRTHVEPVAGRSAQGGLARADAGHPRRASRARAQDRPFHRRAGGARIRQFAAISRRSRRSARPAPIISCAPRSARSCCPRSRADARRAVGRSTARSPPIAPTTPPITSAASVPDSPAMRDPNAVIYLVPGVGMISLRQGQGDGAHRRRVLRQRDQRDARRRAASTATSASPSRRRSTSNTGCSRKPSSSACRSRARSQGASRFVTGGAGGIGSAIAAPHAGAKAPASCSPTSTPPALRRAQSPSFRRAYGKDAVARRHARRDA